MVVRYPSCQRKFGDEGIDCICQFVHGPCNKAQTLYDIIIARLEAGFLTFIFADILDIKYEKQVPHDWSNYANILMASKKVSLA